MTRPAAALLAALGAALSVGAADLPFTVAGNCEGHPISIVVAATQPHGYEALLRECSDVTTCETTFAPPGGCDWWDIRVACRYAHDEGYSSIAVAPLCRIFADGFESGSTINWTTVHN